MFSLVIPKLISYNVTKIRIYAEGMKKMNAGIVKEAEIASSRLSYRIFENDDKFGIASYGIQVSTQLFGGHEIEEVPDITSDIVQANDLFSLLVDNAVLPSTLKEIVYEYISLKYII